MCIRDRYMGELRGNNCFEEPIRVLTGFQSSGKVLLTRTESVTFEKEIPDPGMSMRGASLRLNTRTGQFPIAQICNYYGPCAVITQGGLLFLLAPSINKQSKTRSTFFLLEEQNASCSCSLLTKLGINKQTLTYTT
eukprot:TRINITY_DN106_c0_g1_i1.p3 TRINITY_DN106_c0_g1~~TRINITY_DN106_c0_g1_i1.p3  ORF type:complete len:160 (+),score=21.43 TRINITY_DN106_c0_g1_i1:73-480(+)